eukprot:7005226-Lingulodinium_polyedra.AAC.1
MQPIVSCHGETVTSRGLGSPGLAGSAQAQQREGSEDSDEKCLWTNRFAWLKKKGEAAVVPATE